jgi:N-acetylmuramoyl-L-alanine amidase
MSKKENTIVTVQMSEPIKAPEGYSTMMLNSPNRFVLDLKGVLVDSEVSDLTYDRKESPLTAVRAAAYNENTVRIVCDLKEAASPAVNLSANGKTLRISFSTLSTYFNPMDDGKLVVMLDPGHGESTAGKRSPDGSLREYEFNRAVANKMKNLLQAKGIEVILTVNDDSDPSLADRCERANNSDADIFVSIHANAFGNGQEWTSANGWEIYHYPGSFLSNQLATSISNSNFPEIGIHNRGIKTANLYVIKNTYMPAVLIEHGFFTNSEEIKLLKSDEWREKVARYNVEGIVNFLNSY